MSDSISRQAAIRWIKAECNPYGKPTLDYKTSCRIMEHLNRMPSAEPEQHGRIFQEIIVEYPSISTYLEYKGKPYFSIKYTEDGQGYIGYGTYKPEVLSEYLKKYFIPSAEPERKWTPCSERLPDEFNRNYLVTIKRTGNDFESYTENDIAYFDPLGFHKADEVIAWMPLPKPYKGDF